jgi:hypothetical protein
VGAKKDQVIRASTGIMYDQPLLAVYENAIQQNGLPARTTYTVPGTGLGAPAFPGTLSNVPAGAVLPAQSIFAPDPDLKLAYNIQNSVQYDRGFGRSYHGSVGVVYNRGYNLPVITNINLINPIGSTPSGIPIFSSAVSAATRVDPRYNAVNATQSIGESTYRNMTLQLTRRSTTFGFDLAYTLGKSEDNAPITNILSVQGDPGRTDPTNLDRDLGPNVLDQRHTFSGSIVAAPHFDKEGIAGALLNDNVFGIALQFASGIPVNLRSNLELNNDGTASDRPSGVPRNSLNLPNRYNVDLRYSRRFRIQGAMAAEVIAELKNAFNTVQISSVNATIQTNTLGVPLVTLPTSGDDLPPTGGYEQRQFQLGFKFIF